MALPELLLVAVGLSMDAFAVSICKGLSVRTRLMRSMCIVGLYFGVSQALMPLLGYWLGSSFSRLVSAYDHWIAFVLLGIIGGRMVYDSIRYWKCEAELPEASLHIRVMLPLALATSIDALAVGVTFAFLQVEILPAILLIGAVTFALSAAGVWVGRIFGAKLHAKATLVGGLALVGMGVKILVEHLTA